MADCPVVAVDVGILLRLARLNVFDRNATIFGPSQQLHADVFRAVVDPDHLRRSSPFDDPLKRACHPLARFSATHTATPSTFSTRERKRRKRPKLLCLNRKNLVLPEGIELSTSPLPRECSTTELRQLRDQLVAAPMRQVAAAPNGAPEVRPGRDDRVARLRDAGGHCHKRCCVASHPVKIACVCQKSVRAGHDCRHGTAINDEGQSPWKSRSMANKVSARAARTARRTLGR